MVAHDLERSLPIGCPERVGRVGERVVVQGSVKPRQANRERSGRQCGQPVCRDVGQQAGDAADGAADEGEEPGSATDVVGLEVDGAGDGVR